jgi:hypothetical protein
MMTDINGLKIFNDSFCMRLLMRFWRWQQLFLKKAAVLEKLSVGLVEMNYQYNAQTIPTKHKSLPINWKISCSEKHREYLAFYFLWKWYKAEGKETIAYFHANAENYMYR